MSNGHHNHEGMDHGDHGSHGAHDGSHDMTTAPAPVPYQSHAAAEQIVSKVVGEVMSPHMHHVEMEMMQMSFHFGTKETLLFEFWKVDSTMGMLLSCVVVFLMALSYEALKTLRGSLAYKERRSRYSAVRTVNGVAGPAGTPEADLVPSVGMLNTGHLQQTFLYMLQLIIAYLLMLLFMCFNVWICLAVVIGAATGYLLFGWHRASTNGLVLSDHCSA